MSKLGAKPIIIPAGTEIKFEDHKINVSGPKGNIIVPKLDQIEVTISGSEVTLQPSGDNQQTRMNWGTMHSLICNAIDGVNTGYIKKLELEGVGYKVSLEGKELVLKVGFSHLVRFPIPEGITVVVEKNKISVSGIEKQQVGQVAANIRKIKKPEPYLGKGIRYEGEVVRRKAGKKAGTAK